MKRFSLIRTAKHCRLVVPMLAAYAPQKEGLNISSLLKKVINRNTVAMSFVGNTTKLIISPAQNGSNACIPLKDQKFNSVS